MRDRLIALGIRRPTRTKDEDANVPMLTESDFELRRLADNCTVVPSSFSLMRNLDTQRELVTMCIAKPRLCICIGRMLRTQYWVAQGNHRASLSTSADKSSTNFDEIEEIDKSLMSWFKSLPATCKHTTPMATQKVKGQAIVFLQRTLLHMIYYTTIYALHRPNCSKPSQRHMPTIPMGFRKFLD